MLRNSQRTVSKLHQGPFWDIPKPLLICPDGSIIFHCCKMSNSYPQPNPLAKSFAKIPWSEGLTSMGRKRCLYPRDHY